MTAYPLNMINTRAARKRTGGSPPLTAASPTSPDP